MSHIVAQHTLSGVIPQVPGGAAALRLTALERAALCTLQLGPTCLQRADVGTYTHSPESFLKCPGAQRHCGSQHWRELHSARSSLARHVSSGQMLGHVSYSSAYSSDTHSPESFLKCPGAQRHCGSQHWRELHSARSSLARHVSSGQTHTLSGVIPQVAGGAAALRLTALERAALCTLQLGPTCLQRADVGTYTHSLESFLKCPGSQRHCGSQHWRELHSARSSLARHVSSGQTLGHVSCI
ncbi:hypothetical protein JYU34_004116 [Plutella xylostella]|uniref:Uncharacterized protein n=1 Tax=Plutella xylostella TaxID=51655 RepID=A0ABQ7QX69_PLUXY|nr:hypothetical protein JYU34_004116 [Plutella xylostella]